MCGRARRFTWKLTSIIVLLAASVTSVADSDPPTAGGDGEGDRAHTNRSADADSPRKINARVPDRPPMVVLAGRRNHGRYYADRRYGLGHRYPLTLPGRYYGAYGPYQRQMLLSDAYYAGRYDERYDRQHRQNRRDVLQRRKRLVSKHDEALQSGINLLHEGQYVQAIVALTMAAKLDQGDPACRIHLMQARLARGHYTEAALVLRRALELQPKLVFADLHLDEYLPPDEPLQQQVSALSDWLEENDVRPEIHFLLGYLEFQLGEFDAAHTAFQRASQELKRDDLTQEYLSLTQPETPGGD